MTGLSTYILVCKRSNIADSCEDSSSWAPHYHRIPRLARVSQQQHVQQGVWKSVQLIKACKHRDLHAPCPSHQRLTVVCCSAACCKFAPRTARTNPLNILPAPFFFPTPHCLPLSCKFTSFTTVGLLCEFTLCVHDVSAELSRCMYVRACVCLAPYCMAWLW